MEDTGRTLFIFFSIRIKGITNERASSEQRVGHFLRGGKIKRIGKGPWPGDRPF